jgi:hypothetical protein
MQRTWKPTTAGILTTIAGVIGIGRGVLLLTLGGMIGDLGDLINKWVGAFMPGTVQPLVDIPLRIVDMITITSTVMIVVGIVSLAFGIVSLVGGIHAMRRKAWRLALAGSILAIPASALLGILSIIFVSIGKREFIASTKG